VQNIEFADKQLTFPPPEKWTETQYAIFEEPLVSHLQSDAAIPAICVRDSVELRMQNVKIPKDSRVTVTEIMLDHQLCKVEFAGSVGLYKLQDFVRIDNP